MAITCDGPALAVIAPDEDERAAHEQDLTALAATSPLRVLCRYATDREPDAWLAGVLGAHPDLADVTFAAARDGQRLAVAGEIDAGTADRFAAILHSAVDAGVHTLDLAGLDFLAAAGVRALDLALEQLAARDQPLTLTRVPRPVRRVVDLCGITASDTLRIAP
jgi:anti-anti-sigma factor